ncbi:MATE family efflux transporter [Desulfovibrio piger]|uniref:MATE family efflux transporter n=1 Tax=Desulfovibrio piger TaxID=901 RepID=UPI0026F22B6A|nr:MATE family efflux transporter [Desulfovibrio piger]
MSQNRASMLDRPVAQTFFRYGLPWSAAFLLLSSAGLVDTIFIGRYVGAQALAAVNIVSPVFSIFFGMGVMLSVGGTVRSAHHVGRGDLRAASAVFGRTMLLILLAGLVLALLSLLFRPLLLALLGADGDVMRPAHQYLTTILLFSPVLPASYALSQFARVDQHPTLASLGLILSAAVNIFLDYLFIARFGWGVQGAALATGLGCTLLLFLIHFLSRRALLRLTLKGCGWREILRASLNGSAESINEISVGSIILLINHLMMARFGSSGVAAFTVVSYGSWFGLTLAYGLSDTLSPLVSANHAAGLRQRTHRFLHVALLSLLALGVIMFLVFSLYPQELARLFLPDNAAVGSLACDFIADFRWSFFFSGLNMGIACYLTGLNRSLQAVGMALSRSLVFPALFLSLFALWLEDEHIFWAIPLAEALTLLLGIGLLVHGRRRTGW